MSRFHRKYYYVMQVITFNANGIRSAAGKGFFNWLSGRDTDLVCVQETRAQSRQLPADSYHPADYRCYYHDAERKSYSRVVLYARP